MNINNVLLKLDISNEGDLNKYKEALNRLSDGINDIISTKFISRREREALYIMFICNFFNELFGEDTDKRLFGDKPYFNRCFNALKQLQNEVISQKKNLRGLIINFPCKDKLNKN